MKRSSALLMFLLLAAPLQLPVDGGARAGTGSWPPPGSGDWNITADTTVDGENITLDGNISLEANLTLRNTTLRFNSSYRIEGNGSLSLVNSTVSSAVGSFGLSVANFTCSFSELSNFSAVVAGAERFAADGCVFRSPGNDTANGTIIQRAGAGALDRSRFINSRIELNGTGASLSAANSTFAETDGAYAGGFITVVSGGEIIVRDSEFYDAGSGIAVHNGPVRAVFEGNLFRNVSRAIVMSDPDEELPGGMDATVRGNTILTYQTAYPDDAASGIAVYNGTAVIAGNTIHIAAGRISEGILAHSHDEDQSLALNLTDNILSGNLTGVRILSHGGDINASLSNNTFSTPTGLDVWGSAGSTTRLAGDAFHNSSLVLWYDTRVDADSVVFNGSPIVFSGRDSAFIGSNIDSDLELRVNGNSTTSLLDSAVEINGTLGGQGPGRVELVNTTAVTNLTFLDGDSALSAYWHLHPRTLFENGTPAAGAGIELRAANGTVLNSLQTGPDGFGPLLKVQEYRQDRSGKKPFTPHSLKAALGNLSNTTVFTLNRSRDVPLVLRPAPVNDTTPPALTILEPADRTFINATRFAARGTTSDAYGIAKVEVALDGGPWGAAAYNATTGEWNITIAVSGDGLHALAALATDTNGNSARADANFVLDTLRPSLNISFPPDNFYTNQTVVDVNGTTEPGAVVSVGGRIVPTANGTFDVPVNLAEGMNRVIVEAADFAGNRNVTVLNITLDTIPPLLILASPPAGFLTNRSAVLFSGLTEPGALVDVGGRMLLAPDGYFSLNLSLPPGPTTIFVAVADRAGNINYASRSVTVDLTAPAVALASPRNGTRTLKENTTLLGSTEPGARVWVNGKEVAVESGGQFRAVVNLTMGSNHITVTAVDRAGNMYAVTTTVIRGELQTARPPEQSPYLFLGAAAAVGLVLLGLGYFVRRRI